MKKSTVILSILFFAFSCTNRDVPRVVDCNTSDLAILMSTKTAPSGCNATDGEIVVTSTGGKQPYSYSINGAAFQASGNFTALGSGDFSITVKDADLCQRTVSVNLPALNSTLTGTLKATANSGCSVANGSIAVTASLGVGPYQYQLNTNGFVSSATFSGLAAGTYNISIKDSKGCIKALAGAVETAPTSISYANEISTILTASCALPSCHAAGSPRGDWTTYDNVKARSATIKARTANKSMPPAGSTALTQAQIDLIGCWVTGGAPNN
jgi:hypothetical protein